MLPVTKVEHSRAKVKMMKLSKQKLNMDSTLFHKKSENDLVQSYFTLAVQY